MKTSSKLFVSTIAVAIAGFASGAVSAQEINLMPENGSSFVSQKTRAEVRAELQQAVADHRVARNGEEYPDLAIGKFVSTKSRAQVLAETREAARLGLIPRNGQEYKDVAAPTAQQLRMVELAGERVLGIQTASR